MPASPPPQRVQGPVGIIDIGSSSLRLVVYQRLDRSLSTIFNEKAMCGLGKGLETTGELDPEGVEQALMTLDRFAHIVRGLGVKSCDVIATAAVRDAGNGQDFIRKVKQLTGLKIRILGGSEEAALSAQGVLFGAPGASGVIGDLGGGSLELTMIENGRLQQTASAPLGPLRLMETAGGKLSTIERVINQHLSQMLWLGGVMRRTVYPVGGNWRALAKLHMEINSYPLQIVHNYTVDAKEFGEFLNHIARRRGDDLSKFRSVSKSRAPALPFAALTFERLLAFCRPDKLVFSAYGLREGYMFSKLPPEEQVADPLMHYADHAPGRPGLAKFVPALVRWTDDIFKGESAERKRLRRALCLMSDISWNEHPDYRGRHAFNHILTLPAGTLTHAERVFLGLAAYVRYTGQVDAGETAVAIKLLTKAERDDAMALGAVLRLAYTLTGGAADLLAESRLKLADDELHMKLTQVGAALLNDTVERRLQAAAKAFKVHSRLTVSSR